MPRKTPVIYNMLVRKVFLLLLLAPVGVFAQFHNALVYADDYFVPTPDSLAVIQALKYINDNLVPITWSLYYQDPSGFGSALSRGGWSIVIVDHANNPGMGTYWDSLAQWATGGPFGHRRLVVSSFDIDGSTTGSTTLWSLLGVDSVAGDVPDLAPVVIWDGQVFGPGAPQVMPDTMGFVDLTYTDEGDSFKMAPGYTPLAGWGGSYSGSNAASVLSPNCSWALNSFIVQQAQNDADSDGVLDGVEFYIDLIWFVLYCPGLASPEPVENPGPRVLTPVFNGQLLIQSPQPGLAVLWDPTGRKVRESRLIHGVNRLSTSDLKPGVYMVAIRGSKRSSVFKCLKVKP